MAEIERITFTHQEVVEALLKSRGIHEGLWTLSIEFGFDAQYVGSSADCLHPTAIVAVTGIGLRADQMNNLTVDASKVNPIKD